MFDPSLLLPVATLGASLLAGAIYEFVKQVLLPKLTGSKPEVSTVSYGEKMSRLTKSLVESSAEIDRILKEIADVRRDRESSIANLETQLKDLSEREKQLQDKISTLEKVPLPAVDYFVSAMEKGEKRSAWRDYILFGLGVIVSTVSAIILKLVFGI